MQNKLEPGRLLFNDGSLSEAGYATSLVKEYNRDHIKANKLRIKEWDYYYLGNDKYGVAFTIADNSYMSLGSVSFLDFSKNINITKSVMGLLPKGKLHLPSSSKSGNVSFKKGKCSLLFENYNGKRHLVVSYKSFRKKDDFRCDLYLNETNQDSMVIATPFKKKNHFYYNQKINLIKCAGYVKIGSDYYDFSENTYGVLDWGRGVWTYRNTWYWSSLNAIDNGKRIGFNLGYGFGDTSKASENMLFIDDKSFKLEDVHFDIPVNKYGHDDYLKPWKFRNKDASIKLTFTPIMNRHASMNVIFLKSIQNQVFGYFDGEIIVEDKVVHINHLLGFAEKVTNWW